MTREYEIASYALKRSGNHAVLNWIIEQLPEPVCFFNGVYNCDRNPTVGKSVVSGEMNLHSDKRKLGSKNILYSYEDKNLSLIRKNGRFFTNGIKNEIGESKKFFSILIIRDPFNSIASRCVWDRVISDERYIDMWKQYAAEYLDKTQHLCKNKLVINFNRWFIDKQYRKELSNRLGLPFSDSTVNKVLPIGYSSFDNRKYDNNAQQMKVLERWKTCQNFPTFKMLLKDKKVREYVNRIFLKEEVVDIWNLLGGFNGQ